MIDYLSLIRSQNAYKIVEKDKQNGKLSHAYLIVHKDGENLKTILKIFAKLFLCKEVLPCDKCLTCKRIEEETYSDLIIYPKEKDDILVEDVNNLIEESFVKPIEGKKKVFILNHAETMNPASQNKILKTLEEPSNNVIILLGATSEYPLLTTVKSRVKKLEIPDFDKKVLFNALSDQFSDKDKLIDAISFSDGTIGGAIAFYESEQKRKTVEFAKDLLINMKSSKQVLEYSVKIENVEELINVLEIAFRDMALNSVDENFQTNSKTIKEIIEKAEGFSAGALLSSSEAVLEARKRIKSNVNPTAVAEWLLFKILEVKYKWQKL